MTRNKIRRGSDETEQEKEESDDEGGHGQRSVASAQRHSGSHPATTNLLMAAQCTMHNDKDDWELLWYHSQSL